MEFTFEISNWDEWRLKLQDAALKTAALRSNL
jgi:hypothetical protein